MQAAGLLLSAIGTIGSLTQQKKAASAQKKAVAEQRAMDRLKQQREVRQAIREARIKRASIEQSGANVGATETSAVAGGAGSITSQLSSVTSFLDQQGRMADRATAYMQKAADATSLAGGFGALGSFGGTIFSSTYGSDTKKPVDPTVKSPTLFGG